MNGLSEQPELDSDEHDDSYESSDYEFLVVIAVEPSMYVCMYVCKSLFKHGNSSVKLKLKTKTNYNCFT